MITKAELKEQEISYGGKFKEKYLLVMKQEDLDEIQEKIGYKFNEPYLLAQAFVRSSFVAENSSYEDNEKLEFVGDKVLDLIAVKKLTVLYGFYSMDLVVDWDTVEQGQKNISRENLMVSRKFEFSLSEGEMTELKKQVVQTSFLSKAIENLGLEKHLIMGKGDIKNNVQNEPSVKEDLFEAIIGAVAIDSSWNMPTLEHVIDTVLNLDYYLQNGVEDNIDYISYVQSWHQEKYSTVPEYEFYDIGIQDKFSCRLHLKGYIDGWFDGTGRSKKEAMKLAAKRAYNFIEASKEKESEILDIIGEFDLETAVSKLQMLQDKKAITGLDYSFREDSSIELSDGNPMWYCRCKVDGVNELVEIGCSTKKRAKMEVAFEMLQILSTGYSEYQAYIDEENEMGFREGENNGRK